MNPHMPNRNGPRSAKPGAAGAAPPAEQLAEQLAEALSAWMDGEALPAGVDEAALLQWLLHDEQAQARWQQWQAQADCLHAQSLHMRWAVGKAQGPSDTGRKHSFISPVAAVGSAAWSARLSQQLAQTPVGSDVVPVAADAAQPVVATALIEQVLPVVAADVQPAAQAVSAVAGTAAIGRARAEAANDPVWRWKLAAGFASVAAVGVTLWGLLGQPTPPINTPGMNGALLAVQTVQTPGAAASLAVPDQNRVARAEAQAPLQLASTGAPAAASDPYAEALLQAHSQLGDNLLLQDVSFTEQEEAF